MADEEGETLGLLSMRLCLGEGNQPWAMALAHQRPDAFLSQFQSSCSCCQNLRRGGEGDGKVLKAESPFPLQIPQGPRTELVAKYKELRLEVIPRSALPTNGYWIRLGQQLTDGQR